MDAKHTPGPYYAQDDVNVFKEGSCWICTVWSDNGPKNGKIAGEGIAPTREMAVANGVLFAAALEVVAERDKLKEINGELLKMCKTMKARITEIANNNDARWDDWTLSRDVDAVIDEAKGE